MSATSTYGWLTWRCRSDEHPECSGVARDGAGRDVACACWCHYSFDESR